MLLETEKSKAISHSHIIYIRPDGTGIVTVGSGHTHEIIPTETAFTLSPGADGHSHILKDIEREDIKEPVISEEKELEILHNLYLQAISDSSQSYEDAVESERFYYGDQWDSSTMEILKSQGRPCITINETKKRIDVLCGYQRRNRTDMKLLPTETGDSRAADAFTYRVKNVCQRNDFEYVESSATDQAIRCGRDFMHVRLAPSRVGIGEIVIEEKSWKDTFIGAHDKVDGSDAEYAGFVNKISKAKLKSLYPDQADRIESDFDYIKSQTYERKSGTLLRKETDYSGNGVAVIGQLTDFDSSLVDVAKKEYKLIEIHRKKYRKTPILFNSSHNFYFNAEGVSESKINAIKEIKELSYIVDSNYDIYISVYAGNILLRQEKSLLNEIAIVPFYCNKIENKWWGKVHEVKEAQRELNKKRSQAVDIINKMANQGIGVSEEAFLDPVKDFRKFVEKRNSPGFVMKFAPGFQAHIHEFQGARYPTEVVASAEMSKNDISSLMNVYPEMMGEASANASAAAMSFKTKQGLIGNEYMFDNFSASKKRLAKILVNAIQIVDSPEKILRVIENNNNTMFLSKPIDKFYPEVEPIKLVQVGISEGVIPNQIMQIIQESGQIPQELKPVLDQIQQKINQDRRSELLNILGNFEILDYDIIVSESTFSPSMMLNNYMILSDLFRGQQNAPFTELIKLIPGLDDQIKQSILSSMNNQSQAQAQLEQGKQQTEIQKTLIAHNKGAE